MSDTRLFVGNLPKNVNQNDLQEAFSSYGQIINVDVKSKNSENDQNKFAFITLSGTHYDIESCIKHFSSEDFAGSRLYVTRARESFLERLQRERNEAQKKEAEKNEPSEELPTTNPILKLGDKLNPRKRKVDHQTNDHSKKVKGKPYEKQYLAIADLKHTEENDKSYNKIFEKDKKKIDADKKRVESLKKKRQEFKKKQMIIKTGLVGVDKVPNKKVIFSDDEEDTKTKSMNGYKNHVSTKSNKKNSLFEDDESDDDVNFEIKEQFEGKKGQKVLDLQSRYKSDKRFTLDERFVEDGPDDKGKEGMDGDDERVDLEEADEKIKQLNILQDVLGVAIKTKKPVEADLRKIKPKLGMLRFDPSHPDHAKFLAPVENFKENNISKKLKKKKKDKQQQDDLETEKVQPEVEKVHVSKEQFYKVSDTLKETLEQPNSFSLRSLFGQTEENNDKEVTQQELNYIPLKKVKDSKVKNPLDLSEKNPFVYDSSDSEDEEPDKEGKETQDVQPVETKAVWKENLFFSKLDIRLIDGLNFFKKSIDNNAHKERRELKSVMKKRIYNKERKNQMFQKKIGGRRKSMKKGYKMKR